MEKNEYKILRKVDSTEDYIIPIYLENTIIDLGVMIAIDPTNTEPYDFETEIESLTFNPIWNPSGFTQNYTTDLDYKANSTVYETSGDREYKGFTYMAFGGSKLDQKKLYGSTGFTNDVQLHIFDENLNQYYTGYTIDVFSYRDYDDGFTMITGRTDEVTKEEVPVFCLTRNEHFIGFVDEPTVYSDIFVERGKLGVMEKNLRLSEIDNIGELEIYGNGYFKIRKQ